MSSVEPKAMVSANRSMATLLGFLLKAEVDAIFQQQPFKTLDGSDPVELWRVLEARRATLPPVADAVVRRLPTSLEPLAEEISARPTFRKHYAAQADYSFVEIEIGSMLAPQWLADIDYIAELAGRLDASPSPEAVMRFAFAEGRISAPVVTANQVQFTSARRDLFADPIPLVRETEDGSFEIVVHAASRPNYVQAARLDGRLLLTNGVHKVCALLKAGRTTCFSLVREVGSLAEAGFNPQSTSLFRDPVFKGRRPALVKDFLDSACVASLHLRAMYQIMQVSIGVGTMQVPALPSE